MSQAEKNLYMATCRLFARNSLHWLLFKYGLVRIYREMIDGTRPFAVLSAQPASDALLPDHERFRCDREKTTLLRTQIKDAGMGYLPVWSVWERGEGQRLTPDALFAPGMSRSTAIELGRTYDQDSVIWSSGSEYFEINPKTDTQVGPFPTSTRLRQLVLEKLLEQEAEEIARSSVASNLMVSHGRQGFFFLRGGLLNGFHAPFGVSVHDTMPGPKLNSDAYNDGFMEMSYLDAYLPLPGSGTVGRLGSSGS
jgi:hypothetical protein